MRNKLIGAALTALLFVVSITAQTSQDTLTPSVEKSVKGIQIGESGLVLNYEIRLADQFTLRTEVGYTLVFFFGDDNPVFNEDKNSSVAAVPTFTVEPRWYYNLNRRVRKGKDITRNRANYFSLFANYCGGWGAINLSNNIDEVPDFIIVSPMWGMRRTLGQHFNYELGAGVGYSYVGEYKHFTHYHKSDETVALIVRARFGFDL